MILGRKISLIIPCRNEAIGLERLLARIPKCVDEVVVVDNGSTDDTSLIATRNGAVVICQPRKDFRGVGYGFALMSGFSTASGSYLVTVDGDGTYPVEVIPSIIRYAITHKIDLVSCARFPLCNNQAITPLRRLGIFILNLVTRLLYGYKMVDILSGMWIIKRKSLDRLQLSEGGWNLSPEIKLKAIMTPNYRFQEYHIEHDRREHELSKQRIWQTGWDHLIYIVLHAPIVSRLLNYFSKTNPITSSVTSN